MTERAQALEAAIRKIRAHTSYNPAAGRAFLAELLASVERIADAALAVSAPVEPAGASEPPSDYIDIEPHMRVVRIYRDGSWLEDTISGSRQRASFPDLPVPVSPVEPTPEPPTCGAVYPRTGVWCELPQGHAENHRGKDARHSVQWPKDDPAPTGEPAPCVWREVEIEGWESGCQSEALSGDEIEDGPPKEWPFCPYCGSPLKVER